MKATTPRRNRVFALGLALPLVAIGGACGTSHAASAPAAEQAIDAKVSEWSVDLGTATLPAGTYKTQIHNTGKVEHELIAFRVASASEQLPLDAEGRVNEEASGLVNATDGPDIAAGGSSSRTIDLKTPGTYIFLCNLPAHYGLGMHTVVTVS